MYQDIPIKTYKENKIWIDFKDINGFDENTNYIELQNAGNIRHITYIKEQDIAIIEAEQGYILMKDVSFAKSINIRFITEKHVREIFRKMQPNKNLGEKTALEEGLNDAVNKILNNLNDHNTHNYNNAASFNHYSYKILCPVCQTSLTTIEQGKMVMGVFICGNCGTEVTLTGEGYYG